MSNTRLLHSPNTHLHQFVDALTTTPPSLSTKGFGFDQDGQYEKSPIGQVLSEHAFERLSRLLQWIFSAGSDNALITTQLLFFYIISLSETSSTTGDRRHGSSRSDPRDSCRARCLVPGTARNLMLKFSDGRSQMPCGPDLVTVSR